jgi:TIR domain
MTDTSDGKRDFFVSFNQADRAWATWVAWVLEEAGYSTWFQDWDFRGNFVEHMSRAHAQAHRTLAVLSDHYLGSDFTLAEWSARFAQDPAARLDMLVPVKVGPLADGSMLGPLVHADLTGCDESEARERLLARVKKALDASYRAKPDGRPGFPGGASRQVPEKPSFPAHASADPAGPTDRVRPASLPTAARPAGRLTRNHLLLVGAAGAVVVLMLLFLGLQGRGITATNSAATGGDITGSSVSINVGAPGAKP